VRDLNNRLAQASGVGAVVFDGVVTQRLADIAAEKGVKYLIGMRVRVERMPAGLRVLTSDDFRRRPR